ncbi:MAG: hypothetical protein K2G41_06865 [Duncaniella sp.]|uniref:hypothetical protein n=1 Tax=Duncaniella sp. TaxID=2518496 RepID=UPI0023CFD2FA|nr:hypothetical protein [Duncaniella sp.]MDE6090406.1 hypothetical protein [Duncaniella sp.]
MKKFLYALTLLVAVGATSCKDDDTSYSPADLDRMPRTMFRSENSTNVKPENDDYASKVVPNSINTVQLYWYGVEGAAGYEIRYAENLNSGLLDDWNNPDKIVESFIVGPEVTHIEISNLNYKTDYRFIIRVLSPKGEEYHSEWYGIGGGREWEDYLGIQTGDRYPTPNICGSKDKDYHEVTFTYALAFNEADYSKNDLRETLDDGSPNPDYIKKNFEVDADGNFVATTVVVKPAPFNPEASMPDGFVNGTRVLTPEEIAAGEIRLTGLSENSGYYVTIRNDARMFTYTNLSGQTVTCDIDAEYNQVFVRTKGDPGAPIIIEPIVDPNDTIPGAVEYNATRIDTIITNFVNSNVLAEGQVYYLRGGHNYYTVGNPLVQKGFTLATHPDDLAQGKRAVVFLGGISEKGGSPVTGNWVFGKNKEAGDVDAPIQIEDVIFEGIDFQCPLARNFGQGSATGNYFANMYSGGLAVTFESFQLKNCTFQGFIRGFFRVQGPRYKIFKKILVEDCLFYNQGYYDNNGRGYSWFAGDGNHVKSNLYNDFQMRRCTFYDSPRHALLSDNNKDLLWGSDVKFNITIENCTFINFSTRSSGRLFFEFRYLPDNSYIAFKNNLIVLASDPSDNRDLNQSACDFRNISGSGNVTWDLKDNYSLGSRDAHMVDDGIFTSAAFSANKNAIGDKWDWTPGLVSGNSSDLIVKTGTPALRADEFFQNPNPKNKAFDKAAPNKDDHAAPDNIFEALKVKNDAKVQSHEIYQKKIGDPRWY